MAQDLDEDLVLCIIHHYVIVSGVKTPLCISQESALCWTIMLEPKYSKKWPTFIMAKQILYVFQIAFLISTLYLGPILSCSHQNLINSLDNNFLFQPSQSNYPRNYCRKKNFLSQTVVLQQLILCKYFQIHTNDIVNIN